MEARDWGQATKRNIAGLVMEELSEYLMRILDKPEDYALSDSAMATRSYRECAVLEWALSQGAQIALPIKKFSKGAWPMLALALKTERFELARLLVLAGASIAAS